MAKPLPMAMSRASDSESCSMGKLKVTPMGSGASRARLKLAQPSPHHRGYAAPDPDEQVLGVLVLEVRQDGPAPLVQAPQARHLGRSTPHGSRPQHPHGPHQGQHGCQQQRLSGG